LVIVEECRLCYQLALDPQDQVCDDCLERIRKKNEEQYKQEEEEYFNED